MLRGTNWKHWEDVGNPISNLWEHDIKYEHNPPKTMANPPLLLVPPWALDEVVCAIVSTQFLDQLIISTVVKSIGKISKYHNFIL
jgi:hypothetical protein